ncbi:hypothetical protein K431DRAFT_5630 [Polychaeton citri CBS 116435]|uniref:Uncharacterized protein n=1 Tax=Polychaeton citri CBS 116435 TaxID=1314669 RepID=A0A9P4QFE3_9PEZI|nr:hypothetical protein K431DRAFT_5630 [Polychaeton citri CBS 116435]
MPPVTPSPRRFLPGQRRPKSTETLKLSEDEAARPFPIPKYSARTERSQHIQESTAVQFASTPRFASKILGSQTRCAGSTSQQPQEGLAKTLRRSFRDVEDVEEAPVDEVSVNEELRLTAPLPTILASEGDGFLSEPFDLPHSPKRLRLTPVHKPNGGSALETPEIKAQWLDETGHENLGLKFLNSHMVPKSTEEGNNSSLNHHTFLRPPARPPEASEPLPDAFSPHRRSQKFTPGGMASTLQQWIVEEGQAAVQSKRGKGFRQSFDLVVTVELIEVRGEGPFSAIGCSQDGKKIRLLLVGHAANVNAASVKSIDRRTPEAGSIIGIRAPCWKTEMLRHDWVVGVDWRVLN